MSTEPNFVHYLPHLIASGESGLAILIEHNAERLPVKSARLEQDEKGVRLTWVSAGELGVVEIVDLSESAHLDAIVAGWAQNPKTPQKCSKIRMSINIIMDPNHLTPVGMLRPSRMQNSTSSNNLEPPSKNRTHDRSNSSSKLDNIYNDASRKNETQEFWQVLRRIKELKRVQREKEISIYKNQVIKASRKEDEEE